MNIIIYNPDNKIKWNLIVKEEPNGKFKIHENMKYPLTNSDNWESGNTPGEALDNFLKVENTLLENF